MVHHDEAGHTDGDSIVLFRKSAVLVAGGHIDSPERLSRREIETLRLMGGGHINREIADAFGTTEGTVKNHVSNILLKLGVKSRTHAVLTGMELGYLGSQRRS
jgi:DNA-binding CsgD family transcriptional regulator